MHDNPIFDLSVHRLFFSIALLLLFGAFSLGCDPVDSGNGTIPSGRDEDEDEDSPKTTSTDGIPSSGEDESSGESDNTEQFMDTDSEEVEETDEVVDDANTEGDTETETPETDEPQTDETEPQTDETETEADESETESDNSDSDEPETGDIEETPSDEDPGGDTFGVNLTSGYAVIADFTGSAGVELSLGTEFSTPISTRVKCISQEELISFVESNSNLFSAEELETIFNHRSYRERGYGAELLAGLLGLKMAGDFNRFDHQIDVSLSAEGVEGEALLEALNALEEKTYTLTGTMTAVGRSPIPARPKFMVGVTKLTFAEGRTVRVINTRIRATDANGGQDLICEKQSEAPLWLEAEEPPENTVTLSHGYTAVAHSDTGLQTGEETTIKVEAAMEAVPHRDLVSFIESNADLFSDEALDGIRHHVSYSDASRAPALLLGLLGLKLGGSFDYFSQGNRLDVFPFSEDDEQFILALAALSDKALTLSGEHTAVGNFDIATVPYVYVETVRIALPNGTFVRGVDTNAEVADETGNRQWVFSKDGQPALTLE